MKHRILRPVLWPTSRVLDLSWPALIIAAAGFCFAVVATVRPLSPSPAKVQGVVLGEATGYYAETPCPHGTCPSGPGYLLEVKNEQAGQHGLAAWVVAVAPQVYGRCHALTHYPACTKGGSS